MKDILIAIPSCGRHENITTDSKYCTSHYISGVQWEDVVYYVEPEEYDAYRKVLPKLCKIRIAAQAEYPKKWGSIMDLIIDDCSKQCKTLVLMDDDLRLSMRPNLPEQPTYFEFCTGNKFPTMLKELNKFVGEYVLTSGQYRHFCQGKTETHAYNQRISMVWCLNAKFFAQHGEFRFYRESKLDFMTDYYFFLSLLVAGYPNIVLNKYTKDDKPNAPGGEQSKRTHKVFNEAVKKFASLFPDFVQVYEKKNKVYWEDGSLGVRIMASKAYKQGSKK